MKNNIKLDIETKVLKNGLTVVCYHQPQASKYYAIYTTKYGSLNDTFKYGRKKDFISFPKGIAHFLEHKMFEKEDGDTFIKFAQNGASANAFTSFNQTSYLFHCTENFDENLELLIDMVNLPYFTKETVEKEKGIIEQEIRMYEDNPDWRGYFGVLQNLYIKSELKEDIAGTVDSIYEITANHLHDCHKAFYSPNNMCLVVAGNITIDDVIAKLDTIDSLQRRRNVKFENKFPKEPQNKIAKELDVLEMDVNSIKYNYGIKLDNILKLKNSKMVSLYIQMHFSAALSQTSPLIDEYVKNNIIENNFGYYYDEGVDYAYLMFGGNVKNEAKMEKFIEELFAFEISEADFNAEITKHIGSTIFSLESQSNIANEISRSWVTNNNYVENLNLLYNLKYKDFIKYQEKYINTNNLTNFIVRSK